MKTKLRFILLVALTISISAFSLAADYYVDSSSGDDGSGDGSPGNEWKTITHALSQVSSGDVLYISGTFQGEGIDTFGIEIDKAITIIGEGVYNTFIQAGSSYADGTVNQRVFTVDSTASLTLEDLTVRYGNLSLTSGSDGGGGIKAYGDLTITRGVITENRIHSTINGAGGGIFVNGYGDLTIDKSTISHNDCHKFGGAIAYQGNATPPKSMGKLTLTNSTIHDNSASGVGGIHINHTNDAVYHEVTNCTFTENSTNEWGAAWYSLYANAVFTNNTIVGNNNTQGVDAYPTTGWDRYRASGAVMVAYKELILKNNLIANNTRSNYNDLDISNYNGTLTTNGYNLVEYYETVTAGDTASSSFNSATLGGTGDIDGDQSNLNIAGSLADNSTKYGPQTLALSIGSVAIDAGNSSDNGTVSIPDRDQRGMYHNGTIDIGAYEFGGTPKQNQTITFGALSNKTYGDADYTISASASSGLSVSFSSSDPSVATVSGNTITVVGAGTTTITASQAGDDDYYAAPEVDRDLIVEKKTLTATPEDKTKTYGDANPVFTFTYTGFVGSDDAGDIDDEPEGASVADETTDVGTEDITGSGGSDDNYDFSIGTGTLTITKATLSATADDKSREYGEPNPAFTVSYSGFKNDDDASDLDNPPDATSTAIATTPVGDEDITVAGGNDNNYDFSYFDGTLSITKAMLTVTAENKSKTYGEANPALTIAYSGFKNDDDVNDLDTQPTPNTSVGPTTGAGNYDITVSGASDNNYSFSYEDGAFTVNKADLTATADDMSKTYGDANPVFTISYTGFIGDDVSDDIDTEPTAGSTANETTPVGTAVITLAGGSDNNYNFILEEGELTINKATLTATAEDKTKTYGDANPIFTIAYDGFVNGEDAGVIDTEPTASSEAVVTSDAGTYDITVSGGTDDNYDITPANGTLTVEKATLTVTADDQTKTYGNANPVFTFVYSGFVNSDDAGVIDTEPTAESTANETTPVGTIPITISGGADNNYEFNPVPGELTITKASLTATADDQSKTYGEANPALSISYSGFVNADTEGDLDTPPMASTSAVASSDAGNYDITLTSGSDDNYDITTVNGTITINKATLTVTADDKSKTYGEANPAFTFVYSGFVNSDDASVLDTEPVAESTATPSTPAGTSVISVSGGSDNNYDFVYNNASLTINKALLTATADDKIKTYGDMNPIFTVSYAGFVNDDDAGVIDTEPTATSPADENSQVGTEPINLAGGVDENYDFVNNNGTLTITKAMLTVTADDKARKYGNPNPELTFTYSGFVNDDDESVLDALPSASTTATIESGNGEYTITIMGAADDNYEFTYVEGTLTVGKEEQTITFNALSDKTYGDPAFILSATASSGLNVTFSSSNTNVATINGNEVTITGAGNVTITASQSGSDNYIAAPDVEQSFTVSKAVLTVTAGDKSKSFGDENPELSMSYAGFVNADSEADLDTLPDLSTSATQTTAVGDVDIVVAGGYDDNYSFIYINGTLAITKATQTITFAALDPVNVGDDDFTLTATASSGLEVSYSSSDTEVATIDSNTVIIVGKGSTTITASQAGNENYQAAEDVTQELQIMGGTDVNNSLTDYILIYPNPVENILFLESNLKIASIEIFSVAGNKVLETNQLKIDVTELKEGLYLLHLIGQDEETLKIHKFIKK
ncbi:MAG: T9SS type A sorting domain-containing protein [Bacteroidetes bacterium]|nr:T9SS type A sorting domain-containing protein [Bacteroidota bacterium]